MGDADFRNVERFISRQMTRCQSDAAQISLSNLFTRRDLRYRERVICEGHAHAQGTATHVHRLPVSGIIPSEFILMQLTQNNLHLGN